MSYGVQAYAVDLAVVKKTVGSGNAVLAKRLAKSQAREIEQIDDVDFDEGLTPAAKVLETLIVEGAPEETEEDETPGYKFGYALEILCREKGEWLPASAFSAMGSEYVDALDAALKKAKSKRKVASILFRGSPVPLPEIADFPAVGWLSADEVAAWRKDLRALVGNAKPAKTTRDDGAVAAFSGRVEGKKLVVSSAGKQTVTSFKTNKAAQAALIAALKKANSGGAKAPASKIADDDAAEGLRELLSWLDAAAAKKLDLVTFFY